MDEDAPAMRKEDKDGQRIPPVQPKHLMDGQSVQLTLSSLSSPVPPHIDLFVQYSHIVFLTFDFFSIGWPAGVYRRRRQLVLAG